MEFLALLTFLSASIVSVQSQSPTEFLSLDCGAPTNNTYTDNNSLTWIPDSAYMTLGKSASIQTVNPNISLPLKSLRYFPENYTKFCYSLRHVIPNHPYLVRATFLYGNYDGATRLPSFYLLINADIWEHVRITDEKSEKVYEVMIQSMSSTISVCLARSGIDKPFISTLELRTLQQDAYKAALQSGYALFPINRTNWGEISSNLFRYPYDKSDRMWYPIVATPVLKTTNEILVKLAEQPPSEALKTALTTETTDNNITITFSGLDPESSIYLILYFAEINNTITQGGRVFDIYLNVYEGGISPWFHGLDIYQSAGDTNNTAVELYSPGKLALLNDQLSVTLTALTSIGPLLCASEIFKFSNDFLQNGTSQEEVQSLTEVQKDFNMVESQGDPCLPKNFTWDWVSCSITSHVIALMLSNRSLHGNISSNIRSLTQLQEISLAQNRFIGEIPDFSALTELQTLDLSNNRLTGSIPKWLATLPKLSKLYLQDNDLSGEIPDGLLQSSASGNLDFKFEGNPKLTCRKSEVTCSQPVSHVPPSSATPGTVPSVEPPQSTGTESSSASGQRQSKVGILIIYLVICLLGMLLT